MGIVDVRGRQRQPAAVAVVDPQSKKVVANAVADEQGQVRVEVNTAATYPAWRLIDPDGVTCAEASTG